MGSVKSDNLAIEGKFFGEFLAGDIRDVNLQKVFEGADIVYHLAGLAAVAVCQANPQYAYDINTSGTANVLEAARRCGVRRVIFSSTSGVYECSPGEAHAEDDPVAPNLIYAMTKQAAESICLAYAKNYGMDIVIARFFNVYGPHQDFERKAPPFISYIARELSVGRAPILFNRSDVKRDYVHSADVIRILKTMGYADGPFHAEIFNIGSGVGHSVPDLYAIMQRVAGTDTPAIYGDPETYWNNFTELFTPPYPLSRARVGEEVFKHAIADTSKTNAAFGWSATVDIEEGLRSVYEYVVRHNVEKMKGRS
jgi:nucleoside-diphosphate-sugar epimerase